MENLKANQNPANVPSSTADESEQATKLRVASDLEGLLKITDSGFWSHLPCLSNHSPLKAIDFNYLERCANHYFSQDAVQNEVLDWFYVDALIAYSNERMMKISESLAAEQFGGAYYYGFKMLLDGHGLMGIGFIFSKLIKWMIVLAVLVFPLFAREDPQFAALTLTAAGYLLISIYTKNRAYEEAKQRVFERIYEVNRVYLLLSNGWFIDWEALRRALGHSRIRGVPWLSALDTAVRARVEKAPTP